ncbi:MAG: type I methionyl aminopeptidase [candidate division Zixibacteria bacterium]|nr:type I methionyl aminopeptidase [candidate division Zixibacteria bacterium]MBU1471471.1 type I methionyl aminopeptidase [candidate division Zixibacteria bacterium]MBU2625613.1 type I methionyl aminopeptidase [candidate division Zixibacteria bacterium]
MIELKTEAEIEKMRVAAQIVARALDLIGEQIRPGITTGELDEIADGFIRSKGAVPAFLGYQDYPKSICVSIDDEVVHGIPSRKRVIRKGQIVSVDIGSLIDGFNGDSARTFAVGDIPEESRRLLDVTSQSLRDGIAKARAGNRLGDISNAVQVRAEGAGFSVVRDLVGHGIGRAMHEEPQIPNYGSPGTGVLLKAGMVLAIEPMVNAGGYNVKTKPDGWTIVTADGSLSAHFEHTIAVTEAEPEVLTE